MLPGAVQRAGRQQVRSGEERNARQGFRSEAAKTATFLTPSKQPPSLQLASLVAVVVTARKVLSAQMARHARLANRERTSPTSGAHLATTAGWASTHSAKRLIVLIAAAGSTPGPSNNRARYAEEAPSLIRTKALARTAKGGVTPLPGIPAALHATSSRDTWRP